MEDGSIFNGYAFGASGSAVGEVIFNTAITGYQEIITDPSYARQIVTLTHPQVGNVGTNLNDTEANEIHASALVVKTLPRRISNWRSEISLSEYLRKKNIVGIYGLDTRKLTRLLRIKGAQNGCVMSGNRIKTDTVVQKARSFDGLKGMDLAKVVSTKHPYVWEKGEFDLSSNRSEITLSKNIQFSVIAYDYGIKQNILRMLVERGCKVSVVPAETPFSELEGPIDGVFLSNGPGDPEPCTYAIETIREIIEQEIPVFGICLGHQLLGLAAGAKTMKMKFGHHGANHPVEEIATGEIMITSQNHGFAVDEYSLTDDLEVTHRSLFDGTIQGLRHTRYPAFSFQGHPEASPGPRDVNSLFDRFVNMMKNHKTEST